MADDDWRTLDAPDEEEEEEQEEEDDDDDDDAWLTDLDDEEELVQSSWHHRALLGDEFGRVRYGVDNDDKMRRRAFWN